MSIATGWGSLGSLRKVWLHMTWLGPFFGAVTRQDKGEVWEYSSTVTYCMGQLSMAWPRCTYVVHDNPATVGGTLGLQFDPSILGGV